MEVYTKAVFFFVVLLSARTAFGHVICEYRSDYFSNIRSPERCAARCKQDENLGICVGWDLRTSSSGGCTVYFLNREANYGDEDCGINPNADANASNSDDTAVGAPSPPPTGCEIDTYVDLGYADSSAQCNDLCLKLEPSNRYRTCLAWLWDEDNHDCEGILVEDSTSRVCGAS